MSHGRAQPRHRRRKSDFFGSPAKQHIDAPPVAAPEAADDEWVRCHDAATGASYYANRRSFEVSWTPPEVALGPAAVLPCQRAHDSFSAAALALYLLLPHFQSAAGLEQLTGLLSQIARLGQDALFEPAACGARAPMQAEA